MRKTTKKQDDLKRKIFKQEKFKYFKRSLFERKNGITFHLKDLDLFFIHTKRHFLRWLLRRFTKSYWDHVGIILFARKPEKGYFSNVIVEAAPGGVALHRFKKYTQNPSKYEIGIKRIKWLDKDTIKRIKAVLLMNVDGPYHKLKYFKFIFALIFPIFHESLIGRQKYSCSTFVQKIFYEAAKWEQRDDLTFKDSFLTPVDLQETISPADIANSDKVIWVYNPENK